MNKEYLRDFYTPLFSRRVGLDKNWQERDWEHFGFYFAITCNQMLWFFILRLYAIKDHGVLYITLLRL
jgi:hypothetical protein